MVRLPDNIVGRHIETWSIQDVSIWLSSFGMDHYSKDFSLHGVDGSKLCEITEEDLENKYRVKKIAHRKKIRRKLRYLQATLHTKASYTRKSDLTTTKSELRHSESGMKLYVNGIDYSFGAICTFCQDSSSIAAFHCISCKDFLCEICDENVHKHIKRSHHKRARLSKFNPDQNGQTVTNFFRYLSCRKTLRLKARESFERFYNPNTKCHYYRNLQTNTIQWNKPICLGSEELAPFLTQETATIRLQGIFRCWIARNLIVKKINEQYFKIYDRFTGRYCYHYHGTNTASHTGHENRRKSKLVTQDTKWEKPTNLRCHDIPLLFTKDVATLRIQLFCRLVLAKKKAKLLARLRIQRIFDPITGSFLYQNLSNGVLSTKMPYILGSELWDPNNIRNWTVDQVKLYFRRFGFKKYGYIESVERYAIDGILLLAFEFVDYKSIGISKSIHIKKIMIDISRHKCSNEQCKHSDATLMKRDRLRRHHKMIAGTLVIQRLLRQRKAILIVKNIRKAMAMKKAREVNTKIRLKNLAWWPEVCKYRIDALADKKNFGKRIPFESVNGYGTYIGDQWQPIEHVKTSDDYKI